MRDSPHGIFGSWAAVAAVSPATAASVVAAPRREAPEAVPAPGAPPPPLLALSLRRGFGLPFGLLPLARSLGARDDEAARADCATRCVSQTDAISTAPSAPTRFHLPPEHKEVSVLND